MCVLGRWCSAVGLHANQRRDSKHFGPLAMPKAEGASGAIRRLLSFSNCVIAGKFCRLGWRRGGIRDTDELRAGSQLSS